MAKRKLLLGPAGCGKSHQLLSDFESVLRDATVSLDPDFFFLVPSSEHVSRITSLIVQKEVPGFFYKRVTTLPKLIHTVFGESGLRSPSSAVRYLTLHEVLAHKSWAWFGDVQNHTGFHQALLQFFGELKESLIFPESFREQMNRLKQVEPSWASKYEALAGIYELWHSKLVEKGFYEPADIFINYQERSKAGLVQPKNLKKVWMDGFFDFTTLQRAWLSELIEATDEMIVTITLDPREERRELFEPIEETVRYFKQKGFEIEALEGGAYHRTSKKPLQHIEENIFVDKEGSLLSAEQDVVVFQAVGMQGEVEMIARTILHMQRTRQYRFSDFAILLRQVSEYEGLMRSIFERYGIPVDLHERERLREAPIIAPILHLLRIFYEGWRRQDVTDFLKSEYVKQWGENEADLNGVFRLEHAAIEKAIFKGRKRWESVWNVQPFKDEKIPFEKQKEECLKPLLQLENDLNQASSITQLTNRIRKAVLSDFKIQPNAEHRNHEVLKRDSMGFQRFLALLEEIERSPVFKKEEQWQSEEEGDSTLLAQFCEHFFRLVDIDLYSLHVEDANCVQVYNVSLARQKEYRVVFVAGLLEKKFPVRIKESPVLSDWERRLFNGQAEKEALREWLPRQTMERYLFYVAVTRATEKLFLTYPQLDIEGKELLHSYYVDEVLSLFESDIQIKRQDLSHPYPKVSEAISERELELAVIGNCWQAHSKEKVISPTMYSLVWNWLNEDFSRERLERTQFESQAILEDPRIFETGAFRAHKTSASRLEEYAKCPFRYFANQVLKLNDPSQDMNVMTRGIILHEALELVFVDWRNEPLLYQDKESFLKRAEEHLEEAMQRFPLYLEKAYQYEVDRAKLKNTLISFLEFEWERLEETQFKPQHFEYGFGVPRGDGPSFKINTGEEEVEVIGKIDRIDVNVESKMALVVDYKSSANFDRYKLDLGVALQLPLYQRVVEEQLGVRPVGGELYSLKDCKKNGFYHNDAVAIEGSLKRKTLKFDSEEYEAILEQSFQFIKKFLKEMKTMRIAVEPRDCEAWCPYGSVCRIEKWKIPDMLEKIKAEDQSEEVEVGVGESNDG